MIKLRTCIKCRSKLQQSILIRLQIRDGILMEWDKYGRSFYLCEKCITNSECIKSIYKANKTKVNIANKDILVAKLKEICNRWQKKH